VRKELKAIDLSYDSNDANSLKVSYYNKLNQDVASGLAIELTSAQNAKILTQDFCVDYITRQALKGNKTAEFSLKKFAKIGFNQWVKEVVGFGRAGDLNNLEASMNKLMGMVGELSAKFDKIEDETAAYRSVVVKREGLKDWMQLERNTSSTASLPPSSELYTLGEYLKIVKNMVFDKSQMAMFSTKVAFVYRAMQKEIPHRKQARRSNGQLSPEVNAYSLLDFPMLDLAYKQTVIEF
jgi:hypothetical protein